MGLLNFGLQKLTVYAYKTSKRTLPWADKIEAMYNPESYSRKYENVFTKNQGIAIPGSDIKYSCGNPDSLNIKLIFTDTGVESLGMLKLFISKTVSERVDKFLDITTKVQGGMHRPYYLIVEWGKLSMDCVLGSVDINYTMFNRSGEPLRAELTTVFKEDVSLEKAAKTANLMSPDVTHTRRVKEGDTLPLMAHKIYEDPSYYMKVAESNRLDTVRNTEPGQTMIFPPIKG